MATKMPHILIAGAGIGGLTAALALLRAGFEVDVYEQAADLKEVGAGVQIAANGSLVLHTLGLTEAIEDVASIASGKEIRLWSTGQRWPLFDLGAASVERYGFPYYLLYRADLHRVLADAVRRVRKDAIHLGAKCTGFEQRGNGVRLHLEGGAAIAGHALVGADGVHSTIRQGLFGADRPAFTGCMAWRGLIPMDRLPRPLARPVGTNWFGPGGHIVHYPVRRGMLMNFVGIVERADWLKESWNERGTHAECAGDFAGWHDDIHTLIRNIETPYKWALIGREPLARWSEGRVTLLGDACHPMLPMLAQGANMALEDGLILARCLAASPEDIPAALARYEAARLKRTTRAVRGSAENMKRFHNDPLADPP